MSTFPEESFTYADESSISYNVYICNIDNAPDSQVNEQYSVLTNRAPRSYQNVFLGYGEVKPLEFDITLASDHIFTDSERRNINKWLVGRYGFKKFKIDSKNYFFMCVFTEQTTHYAGTEPFAITFHAVCDSPYQYTEPVTVTGTNGELTVNNTSDIDDYTYPTVTFTASSETVTIVNSVESSRILTITGLTVGEIVTIDNKTKIFTSTGETAGTSACNYAWLRLIRGVNTLTVAGTSEVTVSVPIMVRVGV